MKEDKKQIKLHIIYTLCFFLMCLINWALGSQNGRIQFVATNLTGVLLAVIIASAYKISAFLKPIFAFWAIIGAFSCIFIYRFIYSQYPYTGKVITALLNYYIYGFIIIKQFIEIKRKKSLCVNCIAFSVSVLMLLWMFFSRNEAFWPLWFCIIFGAYYVTEFDEKKEKLLYQSLVDGVIIGFFFIQGMALLFRPYDYGRYLGLFANENMNALFYAISYGAFLSKWLLWEKTHKNIVFRVVIALISSGIFGFCLMTGSKSGLLAMGGETLVFLISIIGLEKKKVFSAVKYSIVIVLVAIISFPVCYVMARYLPTVHLHPVYFEGEWNEDKVQPGEPADSEKYISFETAMEYGPGRIFSPIRSIMTNLEISDYSIDFLEKASASEDSVLLYSYDDGFDLRNAAMGCSGLAQNWLAKPNVFLCDSIKNVDAEPGRFSIYSFYINRLNLCGHSNSYITEMVKNEEVAPHAHNFLIQISFLFGVPAGLLMIIMLAIYAIGYVRMIKHKEYFLACIIGCFVGTFVLFGLFEIDWLCGQLPFTLFFLLYRSVLKNNTMIADCY